jgi:hypothetical protein
MAGHDNHAVNIQRIYKIYILFGRFNELDPSAELVLDEGIISQDCIAPVSLGIGNLQHLDELVQPVDPEKEVGG